jgi:hypothetical protein
MTNERRTSTRKAVKQEVMLIHEQGHRLCQIHDISLKGALLNVGWGVLTRDVPVELSISLPTSQDKAAYRLPAQVARVSTLGTAIKFRDLDVSAYSALRQYLLIGQQ